MAYNYSTAAQQPQPANPGNLTNSLNSQDPNAQSVQKDAQYNQQLANWQQTTAKKPTSSTATPVAPQTPPQAGPDPYAASGGGVYQGGAWTPSNGTGAVAGAGQQGYGSTPYGYIQPFQQQAPMPLPTYQSYNYHDGGAAPQIIPGQMSQFSGQPGDAMGAGLAPGTVGASTDSGGVMGSLVRHLQGMGGANTLYGAAGASALNGLNTGGQKEAQKETLLAIQKQQMDQAAQHAAQMGTSNGGAADALRMLANDQFAGNLTKSYRDIDQAAKQQTFQNQLAAGNAMQGAQAQDFSQGFQQSQAQNAFNQENAAKAQQASQFGQQLGLQSQQAALAEYIQRLAGGQNQQQISNQLELGRGQQALGQQAQNTDAGRLQAQIDQFNKQLEFQKAQAGIANGQWNQQFGFNTANAAQGQDNSFLSTLLGSLK